MDLPPRKPKWMPWKTYERKLAAWEEAAAKAETLFGLRCAGLLARFGGKL
jgi:hypothetical protein